MNSLSVMLGITELFVCKDELLNSTEK